MSKEVMKLALEALECTEYPQDHYDAITALREALAEQPAQQEPVTWRYKIVDVFGRPAWTLKTPKSDTRVLESQPLYTTTPQRKPLTDEQILAVARGHYNPHQRPEISFARAIEAAHGIKGEA